MAETRGRPSLYSPEEDAIIMRGASPAATVQALRDAGFRDRTPAAVTQRRIYKQKHAAAPKVSGLYTAQEDAIILSSNGTAETIALTLQQAGYPLRSAGAIRQRRKKLRDEPVDTPAEAAASITFELSATELEPATGDEAEMFEPVVMLDGEVVTPNGDEASAATSRANQLVAIAQERDASMRIVAALTEQRNDEIRRVAELNAVLRSAIEDWRVELDADVAD